MIALRNQIKQWTRFSGLIRRGFGTDQKITNDSGAAAENFGGMDADTFKFLVEKVGPFIDLVFHPKVTALSKTSLTLTVPFNKRLIGNPAIPCLHGGAVATAIDHAAGFSAWASLDDPHQRVSTVDLRVDYLTPAPLETLHFVATVVHKSNKLARTDVVCYDHTMTKKIAIGRACFNIYKTSDDLSVVLKKHIAKAQTAESASAKPEGSQ